MSVFPTLGAATIPGVLGAATSGGGSGALARPGSTAAKITGEGLVARLSPIAGQTPSSALAGNLYLPAVMNTFTVSETALHNEYDTLTDGHFSQAQMGGANARQFRTATVDSITVDYATAWQTATGQDPAWVRARLFEILRSKKPVRLLVTFNPNLGRPVEFDGAITLRQIDKDVRPGENESRYLTLYISEWRDPSVGRASSSGGSRAAGVTLPTTHVLTATDTLNSLSMAYYGSYAFWKFIRDANGITPRFGAKTPLVQLPGRWKAGANVKIPALGARLSFNG